MNVYVGAGSIFLIGLLAGAGGMYVYSQGRARALVEAAQAETRAAQDRAAALETDVQTYLHQAETASAAAAAAVLARAEADRELEAVRAERKRSVARAAAPAPAPVRAARVAQLAEAPAADVVPDTRGGRVGFWVAEPTFIRLELAMTSSVSLLREAQALVKARDAEAARADAAERAATAARGLAKTYQGAYERERDAFAQFRLTVEAAPAAPLETKLAWGAGGVALGALAATAAALAIAL